MQTETALRAALEAAPDDFALYGILGDCLAEGGQEDLAAGYWAMAALRVRPDYLDWGTDRYFPLDTCSRVGRPGDVSVEMFDRAVREHRAGGSFWFVTAAWFYATYRLCGGTGFFCEQPDEAWESPATFAAACDLIAGGYAALTGGEKEEVRRVLGEPQPEVAHV